MSYIKQTWENGVSPLSGERMTHIEDGIYANSTEVAKKADKTDLTNPFNFKGSTTYASLPTSGNTVNDTYYCTDKNCDYAWNGSAWYQSGIDETAYASQLSAVKEEITTLNTEVGTPTQNVFDYATCDLNKLQSTASLDLYDNDYYCTTQFISVNGKSKVSLGSGTTRYIFVDAEKTTILSSGTQGNTPVHEMLEVEVPANAEFLRVSVYMDYQSTTKIYLCGIDEISTSSRIDKLESEAEYISKIYHIESDGSGDYSTLREGIARAIEYPNSIVYVGAGEYNLLTEFSDVFAETLTTQQGIKLENGVHVIFSSRAKVLCEYDGADVDKVEFFSPFYGGANGGFTLENLNIHCTNTRYCVHDDQNASDIARSNNFINCTMVYDNTTGVRNWYPQCIGGGCSGNLKVLVRGCYFKSKFAETHNTPLVSYHNTKNIESPMTRIFVENCYFADKGTFRVTYYGDTEKISEAYVNNNSFGLTPYADYEVSGATTPQNFSLLAWLNEVRS